MENQTEIKYYGLTFAQYDPSRYHMNGDDDLMKVVKVWGENSLSVYENHIQVSTEFPEIMSSDCTEITREQFDEFYKKTVEKINKAANV